MADLHQEGQVTIETEASVGCNHYQVKVRMQKRQERIKEIESDPDLKEDLDEMKFNLQEMMELNNFLPCSCCGCKFLAAPDIVMTHKAKCDDCEGPVIQ